MPAKLLFRHIFRSAQSIADIQNGSSPGAAALPANEGGPEGRTGISFDEQARVALLQQGEDGPPTQPAPAPEPRYKGYGALFDEEWYRAQAAELGADEDAVAHYRTIGWRQGLDPSAVFSVDWYLRRHPELAEGPTEPLEAYLAEGWRSGEDPNPYFSVAWYFARYPDIASAGVEPLTHYLTYGWTEGRDPHPEFSTERYQRRISDFGLARNPLGHFLRAGPGFGDAAPVDGVGEAAGSASPVTSDAGLADDVAAQGMATGGNEPEPEPPYEGYGALFDEEWYRAQAPELEAVEDAVTHYRTIGWRQGFDPSAVFSVDWYLRRHPELAEGSTEPLEAYLAEGWQSGADPNPYFSVAWYFEQYPDVISAGMEPLTHYLTHGWTEGRDPHPDFSTERYQYFVADFGAAKNPLGHFLRAGSHFNETGLANGPAEDSEIQAERLSFDIVEHSLEAADVSILVRAYVRDTADVGDILALIDAFPGTPDLHLFVAPDIADVAGFCTGRNGGRIRFSPAKGRDALLLSEVAEIKRYAAVLVVDYAAFENDLAGRLKLRSALHDAAGSYQLVCNVLGLFSEGVTGLLCPKPFDLLGSGKGSGRSIWLPQTSVLWIAGQVFSVFAGIAENAWASSVEASTQIAIEVPAAIRRAGSSVRYCWASVPFNGKYTYDAKLRPFNYLRSDAIRAQIDAYRAEARVPRIAVYTAVVGGYDELRPPEFLDPEFEYVCFTDRSLPDFGLYDVRPITYFGADDTRSARYVKTHPHTLIGDAEIAIWVDANALIRTDLRPLVERFRGSDAPVAAIPHPLRSTLAEEAAACLKHKKESRQPIEEQLSFFDGVGFETEDLIETNLMMFKLGDPRIAAFFAAWWNTIDRFSRRDQLSVNYALAHSEIRFLPLFEKGFSLRDQEGFALFVHGKDHGIETIKADFRHTLARPFSGPSYLENRAQRLARLPDIAVDIVVCVHNGWDFVEECLTSVEASLGSRNRVIVVDDGSADPTRAALADYVTGRPAFSLIRREIADGYTKAVNAGMRASEADFVILLNSDTVVPRGWIGKLVDAAYSAPDVGIVGPLSNAASYQSIPEFRNNGDQTAINELPQWLSVEEMDRYCEQWSLADYLPRAPLAHGFCLGIRREVIDAIGLMDEEAFPRGFGEETDYCFRAADAGFGIVFATHTYVFHAKSKSYTPGDRSALVEAGGIAVRARHGAERMKRATLAMERHRVLRELRDRADRLYQGGPQEKSG